MAQKINLLEEKFNTYYNSYAKEIFRFCMSRLNKDAQTSEECVQEAFLVLYKKMKKKEEINNPRAFLYKTARNFTLRAIDERNKQIENLASVDIGEIEIADERRGNVEDIAIFNEFSLKLEELLNDEEKKLYTLRFLESKKIDDIAKELGITTTSCTMRLSRLRKKISTELIDYKL